MTTQSLNGTWELRKAGSNDKPIRAQVPGCVHLDLTQAKIIDDPFHGDNEYKVSWVHETDWEYSRTFTPDAGLSEADKLYLEFDGLDTLAQLWLNDQSIGRTNNMYVQHRFDVTRAIKQGENTLRVRFTSPVNFARPLVKKKPLINPGDSIPGSIYTRKCPSQWGWDWGPKIPTSGIWRPVRLVAYKVARIEDLRIRQRHHSDGRVSLNVEVALEKYRKTSCSVTIKLTHPGGKVEEHTITPSGTKGKCTIEVANPQIWWPNGLGDQPLYKVDAVLICDGKELHTFSRRIGLRTIKVEQKKDRYGKSFTFVVNGVKIFCKGADWIPADQFPSRITDEQYRHLIRSAAQANMNMLRVWGGGYYEDERFYDLCDEYGILIWHDFMFACAHYPVDQWYLDSVREDVAFNIRRLRNRACLAIWCGNNEMEWFVSSGWGEDHNDEIKKEYSKLFHELIPSIAAELDPDTLYWPSSPCSAEGPFCDPNGQLSGDGHYWEVWHGRAPFTAYRKQFHRFMSEFGFESMPAIETVRAFADESDLNMTSYVMECHQKNSAGNGLILYYMAQTFRFPKDFEMMCYTSQLLQAEAIRYGVEHWRRNRGRCMGALYWQLNDCWPVCSWASIDYFGRWKALQYFAKRFYSPVLFSVMEEDTCAELHVTNDTLSPVDVEVKWSLERLDGTIVRSDSIKTKAAAEKNTLLAKLDFSAELADGMKNQLILVHEFFVDGKPAGQGMTTFAPSKHLELPEAKIGIQIKSDKDGAYLELKSDTTARFVCVSVPGEDVIFSDNFFDLPAGRKVTIRIESEIDPAKLANVRAHSLKDSY